MIPELTQDQIKRREFDLIWDDGTIIGECCYGSSSTFKTLQSEGIDFATARPYRMRHDDTCDSCGWGEWNMPEYEG